MTIPLDSPEAPLAKGLHRDRHHENDDNRHHDDHAELVNHLGRSRRPNHDYPVDDHSPFVVSRRISCNLMFSGTCNQSKVSR
jgi:hypothetical protein